MSENELDCYYNDCSGRLEYLGDIDDDPALFRCRECGDEYSQEKVEELAEMDGAISELAEVLLGRPK